MDMILHTPFPLLRLLLLLLLLLRPPRLLPLYMEASHAHPLTRSIILILILILTPIRTHYHLLRLLQMSSLRQPLRQLLLLQRRQE